MAVISKLLVVDLFVIYCPITCTQLERLIFTRTRSNLGCLKGMPHA